MSKGYIDKPTRLLHMTGWVIELKPEYMHPDPDVPDRTESQRVWFDQQAAHVEMDSYGAEFTGLYHLVEVSILKEIA